MALLAEVFPHFNTKTLDTQALPLTAFLLLKEDEEDKKDKAITAAFVDAFKDTSDVFVKFFEEIKKAENLLISLLGNQFRPRKMLMKIFMKRQMFLRRKKTRLP